LVGPQDKIDAIKDKIEAVLPSADQPYTVNEQFHPTG